MIDLLIRNGLTVCPSGVRITDVAIDSGKVASLGNMRGKKAARVIDATGLLVLPGFVDPHVHFQDIDPGTGLVAPDGVYGLTRAAIFGGATTLIDFVFPSRSESLLAAIRARRQLADRLVTTDYGLHAGILNCDDSTIADLDGLRALGISSIKIIMMASAFRDDSNLLRIMRKAADMNLLVMVHAEEAAILQESLSALEQSGRLGLGNFPDAHPREAEITAARRAIYNATRAMARLYIVHISCEEVLELVRDASSSDGNVIGETVTHYLCHTEALYASSMAAQLMCAPPMRTSRDITALLNGLSTNDIKVVSSDHCGFSAEQKTSMGVEDFRRIPKGIAGVETRSSVLYSRLVATGKITLRHFVDLVSTNPARIFGLFPRKGTLQPGSDADICLFDPNRKWIIKGDALHFDWGYSAHDGEQVVGKPVACILRGKIMFEGDDFLGSAGDGMYLMR